MSDNSPAIGPLFFSSKLVPRVWGGRALGEILGRDLPTNEPYGEAWDVSVLPGAVSQVDEGPHAGKLLTDLWDNCGMEMHAGQTHTPADFPLLVKWLECRELLSLQVHPDDNMAQQVLKQPYGKSEAWVVLHAEPTARVMSGLKPGVTREEFVNHLQSGTLEQCLHTFTPQPGDCIVIRAGTVHAAGGGMLIAEIQQSSDATFRLYDWNRLGLDGKPRALQIDLALQAIDWEQGPNSPAKPIERRIDDRGTREEFLGELHAFSLIRYTFEKPWTGAHSGEMTLWMVLDGTARLLHEQSGRERLVSRGQSIVMPASAGPVTWTPCAEGQSVTLLCARLPK